MKTIVTLIATFMLVAGATSAMASNLQGSNEAPGYQLSEEQAARSLDGAYASARTPGEAHTTVNVSSQNDFQLQGR